MINVHGKKIEADIVIKIPFFDTDPMGIVWHGNYAKYLEIARCALLEKVNYSYLQMRESGYVWPIVKLSIKYIRPINFEDQIKVTATLNEYENGIGIKYKITNALTGELLTKAETMQFAVDIKTQETCYSSPSILLDNLKELK